MRLLRHISLCFLLLFGGALHSQNLLLVENYILIDTAAQYPVAFNTNTVKATTSLSSSFRAHFAADPALPLVGSQTNNSWATSSGQVTNQRFHIDLASAKVINMVQYDNVHSNGSATDQGAMNFTIWGSNTASDFNDLAFANDGTWVQLDVIISKLDEHVALNQADTKFFPVFNTIAYRYYGFKFVDNYGSGSFMGLRHIELQTVTQTLIPKLMILKTGDNLIMD